MAELDIDFDASIPEVSLSSSAVVIPPDLPSTVTRTVEQEKHTIRAIEEFDAPHVEGPIRFRQWPCLLFRPAPPVLVAAGRVRADNSPVNYISTDGINWTETDIDYSERLQAAGNAGYFALLGSASGDVLRSLDSSFQNWCVSVDLESGIQDIEQNRESGRVMALTFEELAYSDDEGKTWVRVANAPDIGDERSIKYNAVTKTWFLAAQGGNGSQRMVMRSFDDGLNWEECPGAPVGIDMIDLDVNTANGRMVFGPRDTKFTYYSDDNGDTFVQSATVSISQDTRWWNLQRSEKSGRWVVNGSHRYTTTGRTFYSDDDGESWTQIVPTPFNSDTNDIRWITQLEGEPFFLRVGGIYDGVVPRPGEIYISYDGLNWTQVFENADISFNMGAALVDTIPEPTSSPILSVERYDQIQHWLLGTPLQYGGDGVLTQGEREKFRNERLFNAGLDWQFDGSTDAIAHTDLRQEPSPIGAPYHWPRTGMCRVRGGYLQLHGTVARISRYLPYTEELVNVTQECPELE